MDADPDFVPYSQRPEWSDVVPAEAAPGDDGSVVAVKYDKHDRELLGYFNACVAKVGCGAALDESLHCLGQLLLHAPANIARSGSYLCTLFGGGRGSCAEPHGCAHVPAFLQAWQPAGSSCKDGSQLLVWCA